MLVPESSRREVAEQSRSDGPLQPSLRLTWAEQTLFLYLARNCYDPIRWRYLDWHRGWSRGPSPIGSILRRHIELAWGERSTLSMNYMQRTSNEPRSGLSRSFMPDFEMCPSTHACSEVYDRYAFLCPLHLYIYISYVRVRLFKTNAMNNYYCWIPVYRMYSKIVNT